ncbi:MAG: MFS transporter [Sphingomicrobium sp.]
MVVRSESIAPACAVLKRLQSPAEIFWGEKMQERQSAGVLAAYVIVTVLFFAWGFITSLIDPLVASVKGIFSLTDFEAQAAAFAFFIAYGVTSFPAAALLARQKSIPTILIALGMMIVGCLVMLVAANAAVFMLVLIGLFILAAGITILQVAANPLAAALGNPKYSHFRLTFSQAFNSLGTVLGPLIGAGLFLKGVEVKEGGALTENVRNNALAGIDSAYLWICGLLAGVAVFFWLTRKLVGAAVPASSDAAKVGVIGLVSDAFSSKWAVLGGAAIFLYVGAEVAIGTQMALFLNSDAVWGQSDALFGLPLVTYIVPQDGVVGLSLEQAGKATALYWGGALVGRLIGSGLLAFVRASILLAAFTAMAAAMCLYVFAVGGVDAGFVALAIGLFNSIMFPVIFTLTLERSTASEEATSGLLCTAIIGGAFLPLLVGLVSDSSSYITAFIVPALCYAVLAAFAVAAGRVKGNLRTGSATSIH